MSTLAQLNVLAAFLEINPEDMTFYGEHDIVYIDADDAKLRTPQEVENAGEDVDEYNDAILEKYGIHYEGECWAFYS